MIPIHCGCCGKGARVRRHKPVPGEIDKPWWTVECKSKQCPMQALASGDSREEAIGKWNTRAFMGPDSGLAEIFNERFRQINKEGFDPAGDESYQQKELERAAACYLAAAIDPDTYRYGPPSAWPWSVEWWKPNVSKVRNLAKAGALIAAATARIQRTEEAF